MTRTRRHVLTVGILVAVLALSGCNGVLGGSSGPAAVDQVPNDVDSVVHVDMAITTDQATQELLESAGQSPYGGGTTSVDDAKSNFEAETGLDPEKAEELVYYQRQTAGFGSSYIGTIVHGSWDSATVTQAVRDESDFQYEESTYNGQTILTPIEDSFSTRTSTYGVLGDGQFVFGSEQAVKDAIDVTTGTADPLSGDLRSAYDSTRDGLVTFAATVPDEQIPQGSSGQVDVSQYQKVQTVAGVYYTSGNDVGTEISLHTSGPDAARDVYDVTDGAVSIASGYTDDEQATQTLRSIEVTRNGDIVVISYEESVDTLTDLIQSYSMAGA